jgi:hypothetical protein
MQGVAGMAWPGAARIGTAGEAQQAIQKIRYSGDSPA